jgi:phage baseplate assembly protein V
VHPHVDFGNMHCMNADLSDLLRLLQNLIRLGTIAEVNGAKARVRLGPTLTTEWLKWATRRAGSTRTWSAPTIGEQVIVFSPGGDLTRGIILPALYSQEFDAPDTSDSIHTTHYPDGAVVQYDHAAHALTATLPGGTATVTANKVTSDAPNTICTGDLTVMGNLLVEQSATVEGATTLNGGVNAKAGTAGGVAMAVQGTIKASDDVQAGAISLAKHTHSGVKVGGDQSGGPQA